MVAQSLAAGSVLIEVLLQRNYTRFPVDVPHPAFKNEHAVWMPMVFVRVGKDHKYTPRFPAVVDSGSPHCMFRADVGEYLGIDVAKGIEHVTAGIISGPQEPIYFHKVKLQVEADWIIEVMAGFVKKLAVTGILGRNGFFDNFKVQFDHSEKPPELIIERIALLQ